MNLQNLIVVVLRLIALDFLVRDVVEMAPFMLNYFHVTESSPLDNHSPASKALPWVLLTAVVIAAILLWFLATPLARLVTRGVSQEISFGALSLVDCYSIAFMSVGLFYISSYLPQVLNWTHYLFKAAASQSGDAWKQSVQWYDVSQVFIPFIVGIALFVNGRGWAVELARRQTEDNPPAAPMPPAD